MKHTVVRVHGRCLEGETAQSKYRKVNNAAKSHASFDDTHDTPPQTPMLVERHSECDIKVLIFAEWQFQGTSAAVSK